MPVIVPAMYVGGIGVPASVPQNVLECVVSGGTYYFYTLEDAFVFPPVPTPKSAITAVYSGSTQIQENYFGMHVQTTVNIPEASVSVPSKSLRSHDNTAGLRWYLINPSAGVFSWSAADAFVSAAEAAGKEVCFLLGFTPDWASATTPNTGKYDNGTTARATNQPPANVAYWDAFCSAIATRYAGRIKYYEIWNEVNYPSYWAGTVGQLAVLVRRANQIIKSIDPAALIVAPIVQEPETGGTGNAYLQAFLDVSDGAVGTGKDWIDICGVHLYPPVYNYQIHVNQLANIKATLAARSLSLPIWNTETGVLVPSYGVAPEIGAKWIARSLLLCAALGVARYFWYSKDNSTMYMRAEHVAAWNAIRTLLLSGPLTGCNVLADGRVAARVNGINVLY